MSYYRTQIRGWWEKLVEYVRQAVSWIRGAFQVVSASLFGTSEASSWLRLLLFLMIYLIAILAFFPLMDLLGKLPAFLIEDVFPEIGNSLRNLWKLFAGEPAPPSGPASFALPQPGLGENLRLIFSRPLLFDTAQRAVLFFFPFGLAILFSAIYFQYLHHVPRLRTALIYLLRIAFPLRRPVVRLEEGRVIQPLNGLSVYRFGGPAMLRSDANTAAFIENRDGGMRVLEPGAQTQLEAFETLRAAVSLNDFEVVVSGVGRTQDGIRLAVRGARFRCYLVRGRGSPSLRQVLEKLFCRHWWGRDWERPDKRVLDLGDAVRTELIEFIAQRQFAEFFSSIEHPSEYRVKGYRHFHPLSQFAVYFTQNAGRYAGEDPPEPLVALEWLGEGTWEILSELRLPRDLDVRLLLQDNRRRRQGLSLARLKGEAWDREIGRLTSLLQLENLAVSDGVSDRTACKVMVAYKQILEEVQNTPPAPGGELQQQLTSVLQHLNRLIHNCNHNE